MANFTLHDNSVWYSRGTVASNKIAAFDLENTFIWSDAGLIYMRTEDDWVPTANIDKIVNVLRQLIADTWTIVIFTNQREIKKEYTEISKRRIMAFINKLNEQHNLNCNPWIFIAIRDDRYRKPNRDMWDLFRNFSGLRPAAASFYCADAIGEDDPNPLYRWSDHDSEFARNCGLAIYNPEEILGTYTSEDISAYDILFIMAADESQYKEFVTGLSPPPGEHYVVGKLENVQDALNQGYKVIVTGERFANALGRRRVAQYITRDQQTKAAFLLFTRPIKPFVTNWEKIANIIPGYANALDIHLQLETSQLIDNRDIISRVIRMN